MIAVKGVSFVSSYDNMIKNAFDKIEPPTDDESFIRSIIERADTMEKDNGIIKTEKKHLVEITVPKAEKKPSKAPWIAGIAALTAAAAGIGFFAGGRFGFGGAEIKSTGAANGGGYTETITSPSVTTSIPLDDMTMIESSATTASVHRPKADDDKFASLTYHKDVDETFVFDKCSCHITGYDFDGIRLTLYYDVISEAEEFDRTDVDTMVHINGLSGPECIGDGDLTAVEGNTAHYVFNYVFKQPKQVLEFWVATLTSGEYTEDRKFSVTCDDMSFLFACTGVDSTISFAQTCSIYVSPCGYVIYYPGKGEDGWGDGKAPEKTPEITIELSVGGDAFESHGSLKQKFDINGGFVSAGFLEKLDTRLIRRIIVDNTVIFSNERENWSLGVPASGYDLSTYEFADYSVKVKSLTYFGDRLDAEYDVYYPNGIPSDEGDGEGSEPRVLICRDDRILSTERETPGTEIFRSMGSDSHTMHYTVSLKFDYYADEAKIRFYDTKHFTYSNDIPYSLTYSAPIYVTRQGGSPAETTSGAVHTEETAVSVEVPDELYEADWINKTFRAGDYEIKPVSCLYDGNILRIVYETTDELPYTVRAEHGSIVVRYPDGSYPVQREDITGDHTITLNVAAPAETGRRLTLSYVMCDEYLTAPEDKITDILSFDVPGIDNHTVTRGVLTDTPGIDMDANGFGLKGMTFDSIALSDMGVVLVMSSDTADNVFTKDIKKDLGLTVTVKDRSGKTYDLLSGGYAYGDVGSGRYIIQILIPAVDTGDTRLTEMNLISVNGFDIKLSEMTSKTEQRQPEFTTVTWAPADPGSPVYPGTAETTVPA